MFSEHWKWERKVRLRDKAGEFLPIHFLKQSGHYFNLTNEDLRAKSALELEPEFLMIPGLRLS